ncbi:aminotransferase [Gudongella sp. DL1XJH-153]|uniref:aminotransferase n=1 Tax=Gudongella sp. DL1XJH-153 TaxID=3409804 RepID=UPI003BB6BCDB
MKIKPFKVEQWMNEYEMDAKFNIAETCVDSMSLSELIKISGVDKDSLLDDILDLKMTYGYITGNPRLKDAIADLYKGVDRDDILTTNGGIGANNLVLNTIVEPGDGVVSIIPTYQQLYSIPESLGAEVKIMYLQKENHFLPDIEKLSGMVDKNTKIICLNNPNNPTGALIPEDMMIQIVEVAKTVDAYILCDEVYRGLNQDGSYQKSIVELYDKGIGTSSMSKVFSLAGLRLGWIATRNKDLMERFFSHRDYSIISCGMIDEVFGALALENKDKILQRNRSIIIENLQILDDWIKAHEKYSYIKPLAGTTALVFYDYDISAFEFCIGLMEHSKTFVTPGSCFEYENSFRIGYASSKETLIEGLKNMEDYSKTL